MSANCYLPFIFQIHTYTRSTCLYVTDDGIPFLSFLATLLGSQAKSTFLVSAGPLWAKSPTTVARELRSLRRHAIAAVTRRTSTSLSVAAAGCPRFSSSMTFVDEPLLVLIQTSTTLLIKPYYSAGRLCASSPPSLVVRELCCQQYSPASFVRQTATLFSIHGNFEYSAYRFIVFFSVFFPVFIKRNLFFQFRILNF